MGLKAKTIRFCSHAEMKIKLLSKHGFIVTKKQVKEILKKPQKVEQGKKGRYIAQKTIDNEHVLRVVYEREENSILVITMYPGRRNYYES